MRRWGLLLIVIAFLAAGEAARRLRSVPPADETATPGSSWLREPFPLRPFRALAMDGRDVSSGTWSDRVVVINFWATWCAPCRREIPALAALQQRYPDRLLVVGVLDDAVDDDAALAFGRSLGINYPVVRSDREIQQSFPSIEALPMTFIVDRKGQLVAAHAGEIEPATVETQVRRLIDGLARPS